MSQPSPFPRYRAAVNAVASKTGDIYLMGGEINRSTVSSDLWIIKAGQYKMPCYSVKTDTEGPGPRVGHAGLLIDNTFIVFGGVNTVDDRRVLDDTLYLLDICEWV
jgi:hypothetical protein